MSKSESKGESKRQIRLGAFLMETGHHIAAWRHPDAHASGGLDFQHYAEVAKIAERAKFDTIFFADSVSVRDTNLASLSRTARADHFEPLTLGGFNRSSQHLKLRRCCDGSKCKAGVSVDGASSDVLTGCAVA